MPNAASSVDFLCFAYYTHTHTRTLFFLQREQRDLVKLRQVMDPVELALTHPQMSPDEQVTHLQEEYSKVEAEYQRIIEKLAALSET